MGCWGVTAFESDIGLDAVSLIRNNLPKDGCLRLDEIIRLLKEDDYKNDMIEANTVWSHTAPMALAEIMSAYLKGDLSEIDYDEDWADNDKKFASVTSFAADQASVKWVRDYLIKSLKDNRESAAFEEEHNGVKYGGWFEEENWISWQKHMETLIDRMENLMTLPEEPIELVQPQELSKNNQGMTM